jgi:hypothetical protein
MAAVPRCTTPIEAASFVRPAPAAEIRHFPRRRRTLTAVAPDPREICRLGPAVPATRDIAAGWAVTLVLAALVFVLF